MSSPKVSVIIPFYNVEKYIDKCLWSVRNQTLRDIEIICVDDCSPDNSRKIVEKHIGEDSRIKLVVHEENLGLGGARNSAIRIANADYIASVDSDDYIAPEMLEILWKETENGWFDIICCGHNRVSENGNILSTVSYENIQFVNEDNNLNIFSALSPAFWQKLWRKSLFIDNNIFFPEHDYYEDMSTTPRLIAKSRYIKKIDNVLYYYLIRNGSIMNTLTDKHLIDYLKGFEIIFHFLKENKLEKCHASDFNEYVRANILFYSRSVLNANVSSDKKIQYLRFLILFRITFVENFKLINTYSLDGLIMLLRDDNLHGWYFDKYQQALKIVDAKSDYITRQFDEINRKRENIGQLTQLNKEYEEHIGLLKKEYEERIGLLKKEYEEHIGLLKNEYEEQIVLLKKGYEEKINQLFSTIGKEKKDRVLSFGKMFAVMIFAFFTVFILTKEQQFKLINYPKKFFVDSKSPFAKWYGALFNITN